MKSSPFTRFRILAFPMFLLLALAPCCLWAAEAALETAQPSQHIAMLQPGEAFEPTATPEPAAASDTTCEIAKAPDLPTGPRERLAAAADAEPDRLKPREPAAEPKEIARLPYAPSSARQAAHLLDLADSARWGEDKVLTRSLLQEAAAVAPGTQEAARSLILLGRMDIEDDLPTAEALLAQGVAEYPTAEIAAFAYLVRECTLAEKAGDSEHARALAAEAAETWDGTWTGGWASLLLSDTLRWSLDRHAEAAELCERAAQTYAGTPFGAAALADLADYLNWQKADLPAAIETYQAALERGVGDRVQVWAPIGIADCLSQMGEHTASFDLISQLLDDFPDHPLAPLARAFRAVAAHQLGYWDVAVQDARAFLSRPVAWSYEINFCHMLLGSDAFRQGAFAEAEAVYRAMLGTEIGLGEEGIRSGFRGRAHAGLAACCLEKGDLAGAVAEYHLAADAAVEPKERCLYLYQAANAASAAGDTAWAAQIADLMVAEFPGSYLTTRLVGYEVLPVPEI